MAPYTPPKPYTAVQSAFIKEQLKDADFDSIEDRRYIHALVYIECLVLGKTGRWSMVKNNMPEELDKIQKELNPEAYRKRKRREKKRKLEQEHKQREVENRIRDEQKRDQKQWEKMQSHLTG